MYQSVAVKGDIAATSFLATLALYPDRANMVKELAISVGDLREESTDDTGLLELSHDLVRVLELCQNVKRLQVRSLHALVRPRLLCAIMSKQFLTVLVCGPHAGSDKEWTLGLWSPMDLSLLSPTVKKFEFSFPIDRRRPDWQLQLRLPGTPPQSLPLGLVQLRLRCELSDQTLWTLLSGCPFLEVCDVYLERIMSINE